MRDDHAPERGGCVEDRGKAACDLGLRIGEKREGERGVEQGEKKERAPESGAARSHAAGGGHETEHQQRREATAGEDESEGRNLAQRDAQKEEGASPQNREPDQHTPLDRKSTRPNSST